MSASVSSTRQVGVSSSADERMPDGTCSRSRHIAGSDLLIGGDIEIAAVEEEFERNVLDVIPAARAPSDQVRDRDEPIASVLQPIDDGSDDVLYCCLAGPGVEEDDRPGLGVIDCRIEDVSAVLWIAGSVLEGDIPRHRQAVMLDNE